jgi:hypothetical protein
MEQSVRSPSITWLCRFRFRFSRDEHLQQLKTTFGKTARKSETEAGVGWCKTEAKKKLRKEG